MPPVHRWCWPQETGSDHDPVYPELPNCRSQLSGQTGNSVEEVRQSIQASKPDVVAVELCKRRFDVLRNPKRWEETDIIGVIREKKASFLFANIVLAAFQRRLGERLGVRPGQEMHEAIQVAEAENIPIALIDRPVQITLQRTWRKLSNPGILARIVCEFQRIDSLAALPASWAPVTIIAQSALAEPAASMVRRALRTASARTIFPARRARYVAAGPDETFGSESRIGRRRRPRSSGPDPLDRRHGP